ncbi:MAG: hypothetical protein JNM27_01540 [Leptospirales bacterium]|nr:hypothetical protein [Leptospirales bacterium]
MKVARSFTLIFLSALLVVSCSSQTRRANRIHVSYSSSTTRIVVEDSMLIVTRLEQEFANPVSPVPSSTKATSMQGGLTGDQITRLRNTIQKNGFLGLNATYGAPEGQRFYPYRIELNIDGQAKSVLYRSNPAYESAPKPFSELESLLNELTAVARIPISP